MTEDDLQAIEARANAATPGPWQLTGGRDEVYDIIGDGRDVVQQVLSPDAEFIASARTDVPALVAEVRRLRGICDGVAQKLLSTEFDALVREGHERLADAVGSLRANRDSLVRRMRMT
jgi:hypothetical protein